jgi:hypothetical protein
MSVSFEDVDITLQIKMLLMINQANFEFFFRLHFLTNNKLMMKKITRETQRAQWHVK